jgi:membrane fusion protein, multidrug efflux system
LVFQTTRFPSNEASGFAIAAETLPVIAVNRNDALTRRTFSLLHELAHLMIRVSGVSELATDVNRPPEDQRIEVFCNSVAAAALDPRDVLMADARVVAQGTRSTQWTDADIRDLANQFGVSREAMLRRLMTFDRTTEEFYRVAAKAFGTQQTVDQRTADGQTAQAAVDDANAQIRDAKFDLEHCRIVAPFTGRIGTHLVSVGNLIAGSRAATSPTTLLAMIVSLDPVYFNFDMSESDYLQFSRGRLTQSGPPADEVEIALSDEKEFSRQGTLDFVDNVVDRSSGTIHARATVPNPNLLLTPGEFARVRLLTGAPAPTLLVPDAAVLPDQSEHLVMTVAEDGTVVPKQVQIGDVRGGLRVIRSGLAPNDRVIIDGLPYATPGSKVQPQDGAIQYAAVAGLD